ARAVRIVQKRIRPTSQSVREVNMTKLNRPKQFDASREEFVTAALDVFNRKGFHAASVDDIVTRAGRSKGGFYHHFASKDQLYIEVFESTLQATVQRLEAGMNSGATVR